MTSLRLRREVLYVTVALVEATWVFAWVQALRSPAVPPPGWGWLALYAVGLVLINRWLVTSGPLGSQRRNQVAGLAAALLGMVLVQWLAAWFATFDPASSTQQVARALGALLRGQLNGASTVSLGLLVLWFRTVHITQQPVRFHFTAYRFRLGILFLVGAFLVAAAREQEMSPALVPLYFGVGLLAIALARAEQASADLDASQLPFDRRWAMTLVTALVATLLVGWGATALLSSATLARAAVFLAPVVEGFRLAIYYTVLAVAWPFLVLGEWLIRHLPTGLAPFSPSLPSPDDEELALEAAPVPAWVRFSLRLVRLAGPPLVLVLLVLLVALYLRRSRPAPASWLEEERERADSRREDTSATRRLRWPRLWRRAARATFRPPTSVRAIYHNVLIWGARRGIVRVQGETPHEYLRRLQHHALPCSAELEAITDAYVAVRYGAVSVSPGELRRLQQAWERVKACNGVKPSAH